MLCGGNLFAETLQLLILSLQQGHFLLGVRDLIIIVMGESTYDHGNN